MLSPLAERFFGRLYKLYESESDDQPVDVTTFRPSWIINNLAHWASIWYWPEDRADILFVIYLIARWLRASGAKDVTNQCQYKMADRGIEWVRDHVHHPFFRFLPKRSRKKYRREVYDLIQEDLVWTLLYMSESRDYPEEK